MKLRFEEILTYLKANHILSEDIDLSNTHLSDEEVLQLAEALIGNTIIRRLNLSNCNLSDNNVSCIINALKGNETLTELDLSGNEKIADEGLRAIAECLKTSPISKLDLSPNQYVDRFFPSNSYNIDGFTPFAESLKNIRELNLLGHSLGIIQFIQLENVLSNTQTLQTLKLAHSPGGMSHADTKPFWEALEKNTTLKHLEFKCTLTKWDCNYLSKVLTQNKTLRSLSIFISTVNFNIIFNELLKNNTLTHLKLFFCDNLSSKKVSQLLATNKTLESFSFYSPTIPLSDLIAGLKKNQTLKSLDISNLKFTGDFTEFFDFLATNTSLTELNISKISLNSLSHRRIADCLRRNTTLKRLIAQSCYEPHSGGIKFFGADELILMTLDQNCTIEYLDISYNPISAKLKSPSLRKVISKNKTLKELNLSNTEWDIYEFYSFLKALINLPSLTHLNLSRLSYLYKPAHMAPSIINALISLIKVNKSLRQLDLSNNDKKGIDIEENSMVTLSAILLRNQLLYLKQHDIWQYMLTLLWLVEHDLILVSKKDDYEQEQLSERCQAIQDALDQLKTQNKVERDRLQSFEQAFNIVLAKLYLSTNNIKKTIIYLWETQENPEARYLLARLLFLYPESISLVNPEDNFRLILVLLQDVVESDLYFSKQIDYEPSIENLKGIAFQFLSEKKLSIVTHDRTFVPKTDKTLVISLNKLWNLFGTPTGANSFCLSIFQEQKNWRKILSDVSGIDLFFYEDLVLNAYSSPLYESPNDLADRYHKEKFRLMTLLEQKIKIITDAEDNQHVLQETVYEQKDSSLEISENEPEKTLQQTESIPIKPKNYLAALQQTIFDKNNNWKLRGFGSNVFLKDDAGKEIFDTNRTITRGMQKILDQIEKAYNKIFKNPEKADKIWEEALLSVYNIIKSHGHHWQWTNTLFIGQDPKTKKWYNERQKEMEETFGQLLLQSPRQNKICFATLT